MLIDEILSKAHSATNREEIFDFLCFLEMFIQNNDNKIFFETKKSKDGKHDFSVLKDEYWVKNLDYVFSNKVFLDSSLQVLRYFREHKEFKVVPTMEVLPSCHFLNLSLHFAFYFVSRFSATFSQRQIDFLSRIFLDEIRKLERIFSYEFSAADIMGGFESIIFSNDEQFSFTKTYPKIFNDYLFYPTIKKSRLIIGNLLVNSSIPLFLSSSFNKISRLKIQLEKKGGKFSLRDAINRLSSVLHKYSFLKRSFLIRGDDLSSFVYYFEQQEADKIFFLLGHVLSELRPKKENISDFHKKILQKIDGSDVLLASIKEFFYKNFDAFRENKSGVRGGQWSNKPFLNTIKFLSLLEVLKNSIDNKWKVDTFLKCFSDWIVDMDESINYFSSIDDFKEISDVLRSGENDLVEFKSTFGFPTENYEDEKVLPHLKKGLVLKLAETVLAMANTEGGRIFIGVVEKVEKIEQENILAEICEKEGIHFLDLLFTLKLEKEDIDSKRRQIQEFLKNLTEERLDYLDSLFAFRVFKIYIEERQSHINILQIEVQKAEKIIFVKKDKNWIAIPKRLNGRVEMINPENEIRNILSAEKK